MLERNALVRAEAKPAGVRGERDRAVAWLVLTRTGPADGVQSILVLFKVLDFGAHTHR